MRDVKAAFASIVFLVAMLLVLLLGATGNPGWPFLVALAGHGSAVDPVRSCRCCRIDWFRPR